MGETAEIDVAGLVWQVRYTWEPLNGMSHPRFTYQAVHSEDRAIDVAVRAVDRMEGNAELRLVEVHRRHISSSQWQKVE
jgi:hypothetical protein